ncbi:MAG: hypothetical protein JWM85_1491, partial [Acidimicrobiaceae bacterium]|nr:hypothetical protein [Acidimicrobiaceae bacterium]
LATSGNQAVRAVSSAVVSIVDAGQAFCSLADARGIPREATSPAACDAGSLQDDPPVISSVSPQSGEPGVGVTVSGNGFNFLSGVKLAGTSLAYQLNGTRQLTLTLPGGLAAGAGTLSVSNPDGKANAAFSIDAPLAVTTSAIAPLEVGGQLQVRLTSTGGAGSNVWSESGPLPAGLSLTSAGTLSGTAKAAFSRSVAFTVRDRYGLSASRALALVVRAGPAVATQRLPSGRVGSSYSARLAARGGSAPYVWAIAAKSQLPGGFLFTAKGTLTGRPGTAGSTPVTVQVTDATGAVARRTLVVHVASAPPPPERYAVVTSDGRVAAYGSSRLAEKLPTAPARRAVAAAADPVAAGYWLLLADGAVLATGAAHPHGSVGPGVLAHAGRLVGIAPDPSGTGYWVADAEGKVFGFGSAHAVRENARNRPRGRVVAIASAPVGTGYWLLEASGRVDAYGSATAYPTVPNSAGTRLVGIAPIATGTGYFLATASGRVFSVGSARSLRAEPPSHPGRVVGIAPAPSGAGYWLVTSTGRVFPVGSARTLAVPAPRPMVGVVAIVAGP